MNRLQLFAFICGQIGMMTLTRYFFQWMIDFTSATRLENLPSTSTTTALFSATTIGIVLLVFRIFDGITDPIAGNWCDDWVRKGRDRTELLKYTAILPALGLVLCFAPSFDQSMWVRWALLLSGFFIFFVGYTVYAIPYWSLISDYSQSDDAEVKDDQIETKLSNLLGLGLLIATAIGFLVSPILMDRFGFFGSACIFAVVCFLLMLMPYFGRKKLKLQIQAQENQPALTALLSTFKNRSFLGITLLFAGSQMSFTMMTSAAPFIAVDLFHGTTSDVALLLGPLLFVALICALMFSNLNIIQYASPVTLLLISSGALGVIYALSSILGTGLLENALGLSSLKLAMPLFALGGPFVAILLSLEGQMISKAANETGNGQIGIYFGSFNLLIKLLNGIAIAIAGYLGEWARSGGNELVIRYMNLTAGACLIFGALMYIILKRSTIKQSL
jgi:Na+/melibiose symporter-like transporter